MDNRVFQRLGMDADNRLHQIALRGYQTWKEKFFRQVPDFGTIFSSGQKREAESLLETLEGLAWTFYLLDSRCSNGGSIDECRECLKLLVKAFTFPDSPIICFPPFLDWVISDALTLEHSAISRGIKGLFGGKNKEMLAALIRDFQSGITPQVLENRLKILEQNGVFFEPGLFSLIEIRKRQIIDPSLVPVSTGT